MPRSVQEILDHADELAKRFEDYEPRSGDERDPDALSALRTAVVSRSEAERAVQDAVRLARQRGYSWALVGTLLGTSGEAARQRYGRADDAAADGGSGGSKHDRHVVPGPHGGWLVVKPGSRRASAHHATQSEAVHRARAIVSKAGGGEVVVHGRDGRVRSATVRVDKSFKMPTKAVGVKRNAAV